VILIDANPLLHAHGPRCSHHEASRQGLEKVLAIEHGAVLHTSDRDFSRFDGLEWRNPLTAG